VKKTHVFGLTVIVISLMV